MEAVFTIYMVLAEPHPAPAWRATKTTRPPEYFVRVTPKDRPYFVDIEIAVAESGEPIATGLLIRRQQPIQQEPETASGRLDYLARLKADGREVGGREVLYEGDPRSVAAEDVRGLPLGEFMRGALALVREDVDVFRRARDTGEPQEWNPAPALRRALSKSAPRGPDGYRAFLEEWRRLELSGDPSPANSLARRRGLEGKDKNRVHVWKHRAIHRYGLAYPPDEPKEPKSKSRRAKRGKR